MGSFHMKSILLGISIGIILTSIMSIIYFSGTNSYRDLTDDEIKERAVKLGMVSGSEFLKESSITAPVGNTSGTVPEVQESPAVSPTPTPTKPVIEEAVLIISHGDTSDIVADKLLAVGLINDTEGFVKQIDELKLAGAIDIGEFKFQQGVDVRTIITTITGK